MLTPESGSICQLLELTLMLLTSSVTQLHLYAVAMLKIKIYVVSHYLAAADLMSILQAWHSLPYTMSVSLHHLSIPC